MTKEKTEDTEIPKKEKEEKRPTRDLSRAVRVLYGEVVSADAPNHWDSSI